MITFTGIAFMIVLISLVNLYRLSAGRTVFDRMLALAAIGTNSIVLVLLAGLIYERPELFADIALTYALLNFVLVVVISKYLELRPDVMKP